MLVPALLLLFAGAQTSAQISGSYSATQPPPAAAKSVEQQKPATLKGKVLNASTGEPLKRATVTLMPAEMSSQSAPPVSTSTGADGAFVFENTAPGKYRLSAERTGFVRSSFGGRGAFTPGTTLTVAEGQVLTALDFKLLPHGVISGRVTDEDGEPVAGVDIRTLTFRYVQGRRQLLPLGGASTNDLGEYRAYGLSPGKYYVSATPRPMGFFGITAAGPTNSQGYAPTYYPGVLDPSGAVAIVIEAGKQAANVDLRLARVRTLRIRGRVAGVGSATMRTTVALFPRDSGVFTGERNMSPVRPDGTFDLANVTPGSYYLIAQSFETGQRRYGRVPVDVGSADLENVEVTVLPGNDVAGTLQVQGDPKFDVATIRLSLQQKEMTMLGTANAASVKPDGSFTLRDVVPDIYRVALYGSGALYVKSVYVNDQPAKEDEVTVTAGVPLSLRVVLSASGGQVTGEVKTRDDKAAQGATVVLVPDAPKRDAQHLYKTATTDQFGKFTIQGIPPSAYKVFAWDNVEAGQWADPDFLAQHEAKGKRFAIRENDTHTAELTVINAGEDTSK